MKFYNNLREVVRLDLGDLTMKYAQLTAENFFAQYNDTVTERKFTFVDGTEEEQLYEGDDAMAVLNQLAVKGWRVISFHAYYRPSRSVVATTTYLLGRMT